MLNYLTSRDYSAWRTGTLLLILALLLWTMPSEATMGGLIRTVYLHGALLRVAELAFVAGAVLGLIYLLRGSDPAAQWSGALQKAAAVSWLLSFAISLYTMSSAWGGINWAEPRLVSGGRVLSAAAAAIALGYLLERPRVIAAAGILVGVLVVVEIATTGLVLHPANPIGASDSLAIKVYYYAIVLLVVGLVAEMARLLKDRGARAATEP